MPETLQQVRDRIANPAGPPTQRVSIQIDWPGTHLTGANELSDDDLLEILDLLQAKKFEMSTPVPFQSTGGFGAR